MRTVLAGKRGIFFTLSAFLLVGFMLYTLAVYRQESRIEVDKVVDVRINTIEVTLDSIERSIQKCVYVSSSRALSASLDFIAANRSYLCNDNNPGQRFAELMMNGTLYGDPKSTMAGYTLPALVDLISNKTERININLTIALNSINVTQYSPWYLDVSANISVFANDSLGLARWNYSIDISERLSISGFRDPLFIIGTGGAFNKVIQESDLDYLVNQTSNETDNLYDFLQSGYYESFARGPSYLDRLVGNILVNSTYGIESLVDKDNITSIWVDNVSDNRTKVDYMFFRNFSHSNFSIGGNPAMPAWFRLDNITDDSGHNSLTLYEVSIIKK